MATTTITKSGLVWRETMDEAAETIIKELRMDFPDATIEALDISLAPDTNGNDQYEYSLEARPG